MTIDHNRHLRIETDNVDGLDLELLHENSKAKFIPPLPRIHDAGGNLQTTMRIRGMMEMTLRKPDGSGVYQSSKNLITNNGYDFACDVLANNNQPGDLTHIAIGTGATAAANADSRLQTEVARVTAAYEHQAGTKVFTMTANVAAGTGTGRLREAGLLNAAAAGILFNRLAFPEVNKEAADSLNVQMTITLG